MTVQEIIDSIYSFEGNVNEWLEFEKKITREADALNEDDTESLMESEAMEYLLMMCDGIRYTEESSATH